ncbi:uncharacterized beta-barrel protein YwiB (DUF1934 family) [Paenibacillus shirakamiensis]|uniref:Uncharacterized beta-barrel protein YwiB (DUF1934 family) n=1 Tax=Paenibacillus shirakamiensis TaxID=1265935 RepID=A0ABS4JM20_9BACL|nr:DUF1934 domain-containing protein [Paenibacillus shirakamiensis]MBP2002753.1 uncharacterized beta-barrel protein YwiB (DUF1934 family) [Paenibacillus shirakamiensis]
MPDARQALITLTSRQSGEETETVQEFVGRIFEMGPSIHVLYEEQDSAPGQQGVIRNRLTLRKEELKIIRHGGIESSQTFQQGKKLPGYYRAPYTSFNLSTDTQSLDVDMNGYSGSVRWSYDLYVFDDLTQHFDISLHIQEEVQNYDTQSIRTN